MDKISHIKKAYKQNGSLWQEIRENFISGAVERLIDDTRGEQSIVFHSLYLKIINISDKEIYKYLLDELKE